MVAELKPPQTAGLSPFHGISIPHMQTFLCRTTVAHKGTERTHRESNIFSAAVENPIFADMLFVRLCSETSLVQS